MIWGFLNPLILKGLQIYCSCTQCKFDVFLDCLLNNLTEVKIVGSITASNSLTDSVIKGLQIYYKHYII